MPKQTRDNLYLALLCLLPGFVLSAMASHEIGLFATLFGLPGSGMVCTALAMHLPSFLLIGAYLPSRRNFAIFFGVMVFVGIPSAMPVP